MELLKKGERNLHVVLSSYTCMNGFDVILIHNLTEYINEIVMQVAGNKAVCSERY